MIINTINFFTIISENEGFGINTDIFETNIINLSVVIGVLIYYGRAALPIWNLKLKIKINNIPL